MCNSDQVFYYFPFQFCDQSSESSLLWCLVTEETWRTHHFYRTSGRLIWLQTSLACVTMFGVCLVPVREDLNLHLPLDVVLQQVLINRVKVVAAHVVVVVGHCVAKLLAVGSVFHIVGLVAVVVVKVALTGQKQSVRWTERFRSSISISFYKIFNFVVCSS